MIELKLFATFICMHRMRLFRSSDFLKVPLILCSCILILVFLHWNILVLFFVCICGMSFDEGLAYDCMFWIKLELEIDTAMAYVDWFTSICNCCDRLFTLDDMFWLKLESRKLIWWWSVPINLLQSLAFVIDYSL